MVRTLEEQFEQNDVTSMYMQLLVVLLIYFYKKIATKNDNEQLFCFKMFFAYKRRMMISL